MGTPSTAAAAREAWRRNEPLTFAPLYPLPLPEDLPLPHARAVETITSAHVARDTVRCNTFTSTGCFYVMSHGPDGGQEAKVFCVVYRCSDRSNREQEKRLHGSTIYTCF